MRKHEEMDGHKAGRPWGKLVKVDSSEAEVLLFNRECTVGRKKGMVFQMTFTFSLDTMKGCWWLYVLF